jgi:hypothetical protein
MATGCRRTPVIFAVSAGSEGKGSERYVAYLPFVLAPGSTITPLDSPATRAYGPATVTIEKLQHHYAISCGPFESPATATAELERLRASLLWLSLIRGVGLQYPRGVTMPEAYAEPQAISEGSLIAGVAHAAGWEAIDGHYDADKALVRPEHNRLIRWESGQASANLGLSPANIFAYLEEARSLGSISNVVADDKLRLAIELHAACRFEISDNARLLTLVTVLEVLLPEEEVDACTQLALQHARKAAKTYRDSFAKNSREWREVDLVLSRIAPVKYAAIGTTLRAYVRAVVDRNPGLGDAALVAAGVTAAYHTRSTLVHSGRADATTFSQDLSFLQDFVPRLLMALYRESVAASPENDKSGEGAPRVGAGGNRGAGDVHLNGAESAWTLCAIAGRLGKRCKGWVSRSAGCRYGE